MNTENKICLICVGSTEFDDLIKALDNKEFLDILKKNGYNKLILQIGKG